MHSRLSLAHLGNPSVFAWMLVAASFGACSQGSPSAFQATNVCGDASATYVCVEACSLGCRSAQTTGNAASIVACEISDIAQNENIVLRFSQPMDPLSVNAATIRFRTASGAEPVGDFLVNGAVVEFKPRVLVESGRSTFGFEAGETYTMFVVGGGGGDTVRSLAGDPLLNPLACTLRVTRGIADLNGVPPAAEMLAPTALVDVPTDSIIQLRFNELIESTQINGAATPSSPIVYSVARAIGSGADRICSPEASPLAGSIRVDQISASAASVVTFTPTGPLPTNSCVRVTVTNRVQDLSGRFAEQQTFEFRTIQAPLVEQQIVEEFDNSANFDADRSAGTWEGGLASFATIGGDGSHGSFSLSLATQQASQGGLRVFEINTDNTVIPAANTIGGNPITITDGRFQFTDMVVPSDVKLVFRGSSLPRIAVRGLLQLDGVIDVSGQSVPYFESPNNGTLPGQPGAFGGIGGGAGGNGGTRCNGLGAQAANVGQNGADLRLPGGHAYASQSIKSGGRGSGVFPASGLRSALVFPPASSASSYVLQATSGGGGGGYVVPGSTGRAVSNQANPSGNGTTRTDFLGLPSDGGVSIPIYSRSDAARSIDHFLVGGSGGGGGGSHAVLMTKVLAQNATTNWAPGCGGGGGGGVVALRAGRLLRIGSAGRILATGGSAGDSPTSQTAVAQAAPGGGGSGGSVLLQSGALAEIVGSVDVRGGRGGVLFRATLTTPAPNGGSVRVEGGAGSQGVLRLEVPGSPTIALLPNVQPAATDENVGVLNDRDTVVGIQSKFYSTGQPLAPEYVRYEIRALVNGAPVTYSDDPNFGSPAEFATSPLQVWWQGARIDTQTGEIDAADLLTRRWRQRVGGAASLAIDGRNAFRFQLLYDRSSGASVVIQSIKVIYRV